MKLTTSVERILRCYPDSKYVKKLTSHFNMHERIDMKDLIDKVGVGEAFWSLRATYENCPKDKQELTLRIAEMAIRGLPDAPRLRCERLIALTEEMLAGNHADDQYITASEEVMKLQAIYDDPIVKAGLTCAAAASCVINEILIDNSGWLTAKYAEMVCVMKEEVKGWLE